MALTDPTGILSRVPELVPIAEAAPAIAKAVERGDVHGLYRAIWWAHIRKQLPQHRELMGEILAQRRLFLRPIKRAPVMATYNGVGARIYGNAEPDMVDGSYIATHSFTLLFVPVLPFSAYLVKHAGGKTYTFMGKVPLSTFHWA